MSSSSHFHKIGITRANLISRIECFEKMAWEQFFLLAFFTRQQLVGLEYSHHVSHMKERLVIFEWILKMSSGKPDSQIIAKDLSFVSPKYAPILEALQEGASSQNIAILSHGTGNGDLIEYMDVNKIHFPQANKRIPYRIEQIYYVRECPMAIMKALLAFEDLRNNLDNRILSHLDEYFKEVSKFHHLDDKNTQGFQFLQPEAYTSYFNDRMSLVDKVNHAEKYSEVSPHFKTEFSAIIDEAFAKQLAKIIEFAYLPLNFSCSQDRKKKLTSFSINAGSELTIKHNSNDKEGHSDETVDGETKPIVKDTIVAMIDKSYLSNLLLIGQRDEAARYILSTLEENLPPKHQTLDALSSTQAAEQIAYWYKKNKTNLITRIDQIPRLVATLVQFDIQHGLGEHHHYSRIIQSHKVSNLNWFRLTNAVIKYCFVDNYYNKTVFSYAPKEFQLSINGIEIIELLELAEKEIFLNSEKPDFIDSRSENMLAPWGKPLLTNYNEINNDDFKPDFDISLLDKYKKRPLYLKLQKSSWSIDKRHRMIDKIEKQQKLSTVTYPIGTAFPMPLWFV
ncbi:hypothetical protein LRP52_40460 [Photobacterium sp. ZSDE20]|uniref:Uncharacterized protein n=1 Tax=Photobacterium pectinilyticum TaxID=2906793 RepID=A0ABT1N8A4_9GAMM|nr:hypothetical protein [Photobacterium sp. ZSDE20]MCQ1060767.1 hypothetical protein [Photobacterium sp. ZSDE20]MDD1828456.1 hypothetical protein [Photobacterium sp. ZSDE20]